MRVLGISYYVIGHKVIKKTIVFRHKKLTFMCRMHVKDQNDSNIKVVKGQLERDLTLIYQPTNCRWGHQSSVLDRASLKREKFCMWK